MNNDYSFEVLRRNSRGIRSAILVRDSIEPNELEKIILSINKVWGGYETYLIPYSDNRINPIFLKMLKEMDPDYVYLWDNNDKITDWLLKELGKFCNPFKSGNNLISRCIFHDNIKNKYPYVSIDTITKYISQNSQLELTDIQFDKNDFWNYLSTLAIVGSIPFCDETGKSVRKIFQDDVVYYLDEILLTIRRIHNIEKSKYLPSDINMYGLDKWKYANLNTKNNRFSVYFIFGNTISDFMYYFNMSRYNCYTFYIDDINYFKDNPSKTNAILEFLNDQSSQGEIKDYKIIYSDSYAKNITVFEDFKGLLFNSIYGINDSIVEMVNISNSFYLNELEFYNFIGKPERTLFNNKKTFDNIEAANFEGFEDKLAIDFRWIGEIELSNITPIVNSKIDFLNSQNIDVRFSKKGIAFQAIRPFIYANEKTSDARFQVPVYYNSLENNINYLLSTGYTHSISNQGKYALNIINKFDNNIDELANIFRNSNYRNLFNKYIDESKQSKDNPQYIKVQGRNYLNYSQIKDVINDPIKAKNIINTLISKKILLRGFLIKCEECSNTFWISIDDISNNITCTQCQHKMFYTYNLSAFGDSDLEPVIYYKLYEVFFKGWKNNFDVPILTLSYLKSGVSIK